jgi:hypothetical protein
LWSMSASEGIPNERSSIENSLLQPSLAESLGSPSQSVCG